MDFSEIFSFLALLKESFKLLFKNGMLFASIAILSMILPSILLLSFVRFYQSLADYVNTTTGTDSDSQSMLKYFALLLIVEIFFLIIYFAISRISGITTILVSSASYTGNSLSPKELFSSIKRTWRKQLSAGFRFGRRQSYTRYLSFLIILIVLLVFMYPNALTISIAVIIVTVVIGFQLYSSVVSVLSLMIIVLEDNTSPGEAMEKAGNLIKGNHLKGFMLNLFINLFGLMVLGLVWVLSDEGYSMNLTEDALIFVNFISIMKMVIFMTYTVLYFQCKKVHGEEIDGVANAEYAILPTTILDSEIPLRK